MIAMRIGVPVPMRSQADFRGTITFASINAHLKIVNKQIKTKSYHL